jgi:hypothetical protein
LAAEFGLENSPSQLSDELITLSNEAATKYKTLVNLDLIRVTINFELPQIYMYRMVSAAAGLTRAMMFPRRPNIIIALKFAFFGKF